MITITQEQSYELAQRLCQIMELAQGKNKEEIRKHAMTCFRFVTRKQISEYRSAKTIEETPSLPE